MRILLNVIKRENFVFFDPENRVHLNRVTPFGNANILSTPLKRAILSGNVIDVDNEFNIEVSSTVRDINKALLDSLGIKPKVKEVIKDFSPKEEIPLEKIVPEEVTKETVKKKPKGKVKNNG